MTFIILEQVETDLGVPIASQKFMYRSVDGTIELNPKLPLENYKLHSRDTIEVEFTNGSKQESKLIVEDPVDIELRREDGWINIPKTKYCTHGKNAKCTHCMSVAPWNAQEHEHFKDMNLKHISFAAWLRHKEYNSPNNPIFLEDTNYKIENIGMVSGKERLSVRLERQPFRHIDHIEFDDPKMIDRFLNEWRNTGKQQCGYLYGKYIKDPSGIPLGIRAVVSAIYMPPQLEVDGIPKLLKDHNEAKVDKYADIFGLRRVGYIWTAIKVDDYKRIVCDREDYKLTSYECAKSAHLQNKYPSPCKISNTGTYGSKFVSVLVTGNKEQSIEIEAVQISNQIARLVRDRVVKMSDKKECLRVREPKENRIQPDVIYNAKNEYGIVVQHKANPYFPSEFCIVDVRHSSPLNPNPMFAGDEFKSGLKDFLSSN